MKLPNLRLVGTLAVILMVSIGVPLVIIGGCDILIRGEDPAQVIRSMQDVAKVFWLLTLATGVLALGGGIWRGAWKLAERPDALWRNFRSTGALLVRAME